MTRDAQVLVVGTGPTGLTLACCLVRHGVDVRIVEQRPGAPTMARGARGTAYQPRSLEIFDDLGVIDEALAEAWIDLPGRMYRGTELISDLSRVAVERTSEVPYPTMARPLQSWRVEEILWNRLLALGVKVEDGRSLVHLEQDENGVTVWVQDSGPGTEGWGHHSLPVKPGGPAGLEGAEQFRVRFVVGCDGGRSTVRTLAGLTYEQRRGADEFDFVGMVADVCADGIEPTHARMWYGPNGREVSLSAQPTTRNFQFIAQLERDENGEYPEPSLELAQRLIDERCPVPGVRLHDMTWSSVFKVRESLANRFRAGRVLIAGDAAHLHSGMGGQGANGGIQDAYNLGWKLAYVVSGEATDALLDTYDDERRPVAEHTLDWTGRQHKAAFSNRVQPTGWSMSDEEFVAKMSQLWISYPDSSLNCGTRAQGSPTTGDRAPDGRIIDRETGQRLRLFDLYRGDHFTLLLFGTELAQIGGEIQNRFGTLVRLYLFKDIDDVLGHCAVPVYIDPHRRVATTYQATERPVVLVRPDGHIAFHGTAAELPTLVAHLGRFLRPLPAAEQKR